MNGRRLTVALGAATVVLIASAGLAGAGTQAPRDMLATPSTGPVGQVVVISNAATSPCGGQQGDGPAEVVLTVTKPDATTVLNVTVPADSSGNWTRSYTTTDQVGTYKVTGFCQDAQQVPAQTSATDFFYTNTTFDITAAVTTTTAAPTTTTTAPAAAPAVAAAATPAFTG